mgnify:CR=1 FL=1
MTQRRSPSFTAWLFALIILSAPVLSGCAAALIAGGAVGGYAIAKDMEDGQLIDTPKKQENKGWLGGK